MRLEISKVAAIAGTWNAFRHAGIGYPPLWLPALRSHSRQQRSGRRHIEGVGYAQYFAFHEDATWAELVRGEGVRTEHERCHLLFRLWRMQIKEHEIADLSSFDQIETSGLDPARFVDDDYGYCQDVAAALQEAGFRGVLERCLCRRNQPHVVRCETRVQN